MLPAGPSFQGIRSGHPPPEGAGSRSALHSCRRPFLSRRVPPLGGSGSRLALHPFRRPVPSRRVPPLGVRLAVGPPFVPPPDPLKACPPFGGPPPLPVQGWARGAGRSRQVRKEPLPRTTLACPPSRRPPVGGAGCGRLSGGRCSSRAAEDRGAWAWLEEGCMGLARGGVHGPGSRRGAWARLEEGRMGQARDGMCAASAIADAGSTVRAEEGRFAQVMLRFESGFCGAASTR
jgi:hypothetical protein